MFVIYHFLKYCRVPSLSMRYSPLLLLITLGILLTAGCLNSSPAEQGQSSISPDGIYDTNRDGTSGSSPAAYPTPAPTNALSEGSPGIQKLIKTGTINLEVEKVPGAVDALKALAFRYNGYLSSSAFSNGSSGRPSATVVMRIPAGSFDAAIAEIRAIGKSTAESIKTDDVTEQYVDLEAQKGALQRQLEQYNRILLRAETVEDILKTEQQIERVQVELDRLEGRLRFLDNRIDLSTITIYLTEPAPLGGNAGHELLPAVNAGIAGFLWTIDALIILFITLLPLAILGAAVYGLYRWRRNRSSVPVKTQTAEEQKK